MKTKIHLFTISLFVLVGCNKDPEYITLGYLPNDPLESYKSEVVAVVKYGDTTAYKKIRDQFQEIDFERFLAYALQMSDKFDYPAAYYDVFLCLHSIYKERSEDDIMLIDKLDPITQDMALCYLIKAAEKGNKKALELIKQYSEKKLYINFDVEKDEK